MSGVETTRYRIKARRPPGYTRYVRPGIGAECESNPWCPLDWHLEPLRRLRYNWSEFGKKDEAAVRHTLTAQGWPRHGLGELMDHLATHDGYEVEVWESDAWQPKSHWRLEELRRAEDMAAALTATNRLPVAMEGPAPTPERSRKRTGRPRLVELDAEQQAAIKRMKELEAQGYNMKQIAHVLKRDPRTLKGWRRRWPEAQ